MNEETSNTANPMKAPPPEEFVPPPYATWVESEQKAAIFDVISSLEKARNEAALRANQIHDDLAFERSRRVAVDSEIAALRENHAKAMQASYGVEANLREQMAEMQGRLNNVAAENMRLKGQLDDLKRGRRRRR